MSEHKSIIHDPHAERMGKGKVGIVGESHIWDGPLSQKVDYTEVDQVQE